jgi:antitoxin (DNA-binding transcriptional repressor) of toxin-antitoxin stability system
MTEVALMRGVNVAEPKNRLSKYLTFAKGGEEIIIPDRNLRVAKLVPFSPEDSNALVPLWLLESTSRQAHAQMRKFLRQP